MAQRLPQRTHIAGGHMANKETRSHDMDAQHMPVMELCRARCCRMCTCKQLHTTRHTALVFNQANGKGRAAYLDLLDAAAFDDPHKRVVNGVDQCTLAFAHKHGVHRDLLRPKRVHTFNPCKPSGNT